MFEIMYYMLCFGGFMVSYSSCRSFFIKEYDIHYEWFFFVYGIFAGMLHVIGIVVSYFLFHEFKHGFSFFWEDNDD